MEVAPLWPLNFSLKLWLLWFIVYFFGYCVGYNAVRTVRFFWNLFGDRPAAQSNLVQAYPSWFNRTQINKPSPHILKELNSVQVASVTRLLREAVKPLSEAGENRADAQQCLALASQINKLFLTIDVEPEKS